MILAHTRLLVPKKFPNNRDAVNSTARLEKPEKKTTVYKVRRMGGLYQSEYDERYNRILTRVLDKRLI